jgi:rSAM/selenodomain-associated transferase 1
MSEQECILFYVKFPEKGQVKTRLARDIGNEHAIELYKCFILDIVETLSTLSQSACICYAPEDSGGAFRDWLGDNFLYAPQQGENLGARMKHSFQQIFQQGFKKALLIGSDSPDLPANIFIQAFKELETSDMVIGPASDGGYYLSGFCENSFSPEVFEDITWSTAMVFDQTCKKIEEQGLMYSKLPVWHDIDTLPGLQAFYERNSDNPQRAKRTMAYWRKIKK